MHTLKLRNRFQLLVEWLVAAQMQQQRIVGIDYFYSLRLLTM